MTFGERLMYCRKQKKISQNILGNKANVSGSIIGKYERNEMKPSIDIAKKIAKVLGVSLDYLAGETEIKIIKRDMIKRIEIIENMPKESKTQILHFIDMYIKDYQSKKDYSAI